MINVHGVPRYIYLEQSSQPTDELLTLSKKIRFVDDCIRCFGPDQYILAYNVHNTSMQLEFLRQGHLLLVQHNEFASFQNLRNDLVQHPF